VVAARGVAHASPTRRSSDLSDEGWSAGIDPEQAKTNLRKAIEDAGGPSGDELDAFHDLVRSGGLEDLQEYSFNNPPPEGETTAGGGVTPPSDNAPEEETKDLRDVVFGMIKAMGPDGVTVA